MKSYNNLPDGYKEIYKVNLQIDKKVLILLNVISAVIILFMLAIPLFTKYRIYYFALVDSFKLIMLAVFMAVYVVLHELTHALAMRICGTKKVKFGLTLLYAYAGSDDYYDKKSYIFIALAPVVLFGIILLILNITLPNDWFIIIYIVQAMNISGAAGDVFVTYKFSKMPKDILVLDYGVGMTVYSKTE